MLLYSDKPGPPLMALVELCLTTAHRRMADKLVTAYLRARHCTRLPFVSLIMTHVENDNICSAPCDHSSQLQATGQGPLAAPVPAQATAFCYTGGGALLFRMNLWCIGKLLLRDSQEVY